MSIAVRRLTPADDLAGWIAAHWHGDVIVIRERAFRAEELDGFVAVRNGIVGGVLSFVAMEDTLQLVSLDASYRREGIGTSLVAAAVAHAGELGLRRVVLTTTNDNATALIFWQRLGFRLVALRPGAIDRTRHLKPTLPELGENDIPIRDELDLELLLP